jgi:hypothetical protein
MIYEPISDQLGVSVSRAQAMAHVLNERRLW